MELGVTYQAWQFLWAMTLGLALGCLYDLLWGLRKILPFLTVVCDLLVGLGLLVGNWLLFLYVGDGTYRLFFLPSTALGFFLWKMLPGRYFSVGALWFWRVLFLPLSIFWGILKKILEKMKIFLKNPFSNRKKSVKIRRQHSNKRRRKRCVD